MTNDVLKTYDLWRSITIENDKCYHTLQKKKKKN